MGKKNNDILTAFHNSMLILTVLSILPVVYVSRYAHPLLDDYSYGKATHQAWITTRSIIEVLKTAAKVTYQFYFAWQGSIVNVFLNTLHFGVFGEQYYWICPVVIIFVYTICSYVFFYDVLHRFLHFSKQSTRIIYFCYLFLSINLMSSVRQGIYWWDSAEYYTFFYSLFMVLMAKVLLIGEDQYKDRKPLHVFLCCILALIVQGGNMITELLSCLIIGIYFVVLLFRKKKSAKYILIIEILSILGMAMNIFSPGVRNRQGLVEGMGFFATIIHSILKGIVNFRDFLSLPMLVLMLPLVLVVIHEIKKSSLSFKYPLLFTVISFGCYVAQMCPIFYAEGPTADVQNVRIMNLFYFTFLLVIILNVIYWTGWYTVRFNSNGLNQAFKEYLNKYRVSVLLIFGALVLISFISLNNTDAVACISTSKIILNGTGRQYSEERFEQDRILSLPENKNKDVVIKGVSVVPAPLAIQSDLFGGRDYWANPEAAEYYGVKSIDAQYE